MIKPTRIELPTEFQVGSVNAYLFAEPEPVLIDTGVQSDESWAALQAGLAEHGLQAADLSRVVITHAHVDHFGQAAALAAHSDADIWVADIGASWLVDFPEIWAKRMVYYREEFLPKVGLDPATSEMVLAYFRMVAETYQAIPAERLVTFGLDDSLMLGGAAWQALHMPGHASMQTCFYQPDSRQFLSADMLLARTPTPVVERPSDGKNRIPTLPDFMDSLDRVEALDIDTVYPGHGAPFRDHRQVVQKQRRRIHRRKEECFTFIRGGHHTPTELVAQMYADRPIQIRFAGLWMLIGYLDLLSAENRVTQKTIDGVWHYFPT